MGRFSRQAPWLRRIFPPSTVPETKQPSAVSEDVQLTQDYLAGGQTQAPSFWIFEDQAIIPGAGNTVTLVAPVSFAAGSPEVWRIFYLTVRFASSPSNAYEFRLGLTLPVAGTEITISEILSIGNTNNEEVIIYPAMHTMADEVATGGAFQNAPPLLLPFDGVNSVNLIATQISGQTVSTDAMEVRAYIQRNQVGIQHSL